ncbi:MAG: hypothetical protein KGJ36_01395 [Acidobacteriota bacterium]|nr:hypothetical protein [Acidobacteriota bacterium]
MTTFDGYDDFEEFPTETAHHARRDIEEDLRQLIELVAGAKQMPLSNSALVPREDVLALLEQALRNLPDEIREARWALRDREELMAAEMHKAQQLMDQVRAEAARLVDRTEIVRQSRLKAEQIVAEAQAQARQMINQSEDFIDGKLGNFEIVLERLLKTTHSGRERLSAQGLPTSLLEPTRAEDEFFNRAEAPAAPVAPEVHPSDDVPAVFDQDAY